MFEMLKDDAQPMTAAEVGYRRCEAQQMAMAGMSSNERRFSRWLRLPDFREGPRSYLSPQERAQQDYDPRDWL